MSATTETGCRTPGWYPEPGNPLAIRFWDGAGWTSQVVRVSARLTSRAS